MYEYAVDFRLEVDRKNKYGNYYTDICDFCCEQQRFYEWIDFDADFYFDHEEIAKLKDGSYHVYARGIAEFESDVDWESGGEEGHWLLGIDKLTILVLEGDPND